MPRRPEPLPTHRDVQLRTTFWVVPLSMAAAAALAAIGTVVADNRLQGRLGWVPVPLRLSTDDAKSLLATLAGASITVVALVVSLTMVVLSLVATNFGPRIIRNFIRRLSTQVVIGSFIATFVFSLLALVAVSSDDDARFVPLISAWVAVLLVLASTGVLVAWVHDLAFSIQTGNALVAIASDLYGAIDRQRDELLRLRRSEVPAESVPVTAVAVTARLSGFVQRIDVATLVALADRSGVVIRLAVWPGDFVTVAEPLLASSSPLDAAAVDDAGRCFTLGAYRTLEQDLDFGIAQYVEIALRALSPAVNDPYTAMSCLGWIGDALVRISSLGEEPDGLAGSTGELRMVLRPNRIEASVATAFDQLRQIAPGQPEVVIRLADALRTVASGVSSPRVRGACARQLAALERAVAVGDDDPLDSERMAAAFDRARAAMELPISRRDVP